MTTATSIGSADATALLGSAFIDIVGDDRIQAILNDSTNFNLRAIRAETLLDWIPDMGTYSAPCRCRMQNGVFRTPGLATSGLPAELRHRFWMEEDAQRVVGQKYVGLLVYDDESDAYTFELSSGADPIGALCPWRHDNRRHLLVTAEPAFIRSGHIPFVVRALGRGPCYLESVVFMSERPQPSSFAPEIKRLSTRLTGGAQGGLTGEVHCVTQEAAQALIEAMPEDGGESVSGRSVGWERLHAVSLTGLHPGTRYQVCLTATERGGETTTSSILLDTTPADRPAAGPTTVPIEIVRTGQAVGTGLPLTFGVPLAAGQLLTPGSAVLSCQGERVAAQTRVHSRWPDGSARWVLVDAPAPSALAASSSVAAEVELNPPDAQAAAGLTWQADARAITVAGQSLRVTVAVDGPLPARIERRTVDGGWQTLWGASGPCLSGSLGNGVTFANGRPVALTLEEAGTERAVIRYELPLVDGHGIEHFRTTVRLHVYARQRFVRLVQRTVVTSPALGPAFGASGLAHLTPELEHVRAAVDGADGEAASLLRVRGLEMRLPGDIMASDASAGDAAEWRLVHEHDRAYQLTQHGETREVAGRRAGLFTGTGQALDIIGIRQACADRNLAGDDAD